VPLVKQTIQTERLFTHLHGDVARLPAGSVEILEIIGNGLPSSKSFNNGVDGVQYISLDGPNLLTGLATCQTQSIKSVVKNKGEALRQCCNGVNECFLSSINRLREADGSPPLPKVPPMKPAIIITTNESQCQIPHMDVKEPELREASYVGFIPATRNGMYLEVWPVHNLCPGMKKIQGEIIFIPLGSLLVLPATTIHGGGMKAPLPPTTTDSVVDQSHGVIHQHPRFHFYVFPTRDEAEYSGANLFDMPSEMRLKLGTDHLEFSDLFVHSPELQYTAENPGQLALGLLNDISPILIERTGGPG
jgi:hypothetical protein